MLNTLRNRLLFSYVAVLLTLLVLVGFVLLVFLATRPLPTDEITGDLTAALLDLRAMEVLRVEISSMQSNGARMNVATIEERMITMLSTEVQQRDVRTLITGASGQVIYDSASAFARGDAFVATESSPLIPPTRMRLNQLVKGRFTNPDGSAWLYVAQPLRPVAMRTDSALIVVAAPVPRTSLSEVFRLFGDTFFVPLIQAGLIGLVIAVGLALIISGSVARPLQRVSQAARRMAAGDFRQRVEVKGPHEVRALADSFNEMAERVATTQQAQRDFLANVSHDLRTPLTSIQGFSQAIAEGVASDPASAQRAAQIIYDETARLHRMVESLLDLARIEAGQLDMRRQAITLPDLLRGIDERLVVKAGERHITLTTELPPSLPRIAGDGDRLAQVFTNLIDNAIRHTPEGGQIAVRAALLDQGVAVSVQDTGEGIPAEDLPRIFERFYQVDKSRRRDRRAGPGLGLGLSIVRQIVEAHGGTIQVQSALGVGTTFTVWLPFLGTDASTITTRKN